MTITGTLKIAQVDDNFTSLWNTWLQEINASFLFSSLTEWSLTGFLHKAQFWGESRDEKDELDATEELSLAELRLGDITGAFEWLLMEATLDQETPFLSLVESYEIFILGFAWNQKSGFFNDSELQIKTLASTYIITYVLHNEPDQVFYLESWKSVLSVTLFHDGVFWLYYQLN